MNKKLSFALFALLLGGFLCFASSKVQAGNSIYEGKNFTMVSGSTQTVFVGPGRVFALYGSTDTNIATANWYLLIDSGAAGTNSLGDFSEDTKKSPALFFPTTGTLNSNGYWAKTMDYGPDGIVISSGAFIFKSAASSGEARKVGVLWKK